VQTSLICTSSLTRSLVDVVAELRNITKSRKWIRFPLCADLFSLEIVVPPEAAEFTNWLHPDADF
jgi:hypothetical protein